MSNRLLAVFAYIQRQTQRNTCAHTVAAEMTATAEHVLKIVAADWTFWTGGWGS